ncbi:MAG: TlpA family protein disulfide reductase [Myxococcales bacterium FL481]|nr:MAG: TlpA family protein disulfide reductase [Myxococcales bacterium FL481]
MRFRTSCLPTPMRTCVCDSRRPVSPTANSAPHSNSSSTIRMATKTNRPLLLLSASAFIAFAACDSGGTATPEDGAAAKAGSDGGGEGGTYRTLEITLPDLNDDDYTLTSRSENDLHILCFWAVWCTPCQAELNAMMPMWENMRSRGLNVYAVSIDGPDSQARVAPHVQQAGWEFPVLLDRETEVLSKYHPKGDVPFYVILDAEGEVVKTHQGYVKGDMEALEQYLQETLPAAGE